MIKSDSQTLNIAPLLSVPAGLAGALSILIVNAPEAARYVATDSETARSVVYADMRSLNSSMMAQIAPQAIIAPLIGEHWDIVDLGERLRACGYQGDLYALTPPLPRAELVIREVNAVCPALTVHLLEVV